MRRTGQDGQFHLAPVLGVTLRKLGRFVMGKARQHIGPGLDQQQRRGGQGLGGLDDVQRAFTAHAFNPTKIIVQIEVVVFVRRHGRFFGHGGDQVIAATAANQVSQGGVVRACLAAGIGCMVRAHAGHQHLVAAAGKAQRAHALGCGVKVGRMGFEPHDGTVDVLHRGRMRGLAIEAKVHRRHHHAQRRQLLVDRAVAGAVKAVPTAAVHIEQHWPRLWAGLGRHVDAALQIHARCGFVNHIFFDHIQWVADVKHGVFRGWVCQSKSSCV